MVLVLLLSAFVESGLHQLDEYPSCLRMLRVKLISGLAVRYGWREESASPLIRRRALVSPVHQ